MPAPAPANTVPVTAVPVLGVLGELDAPRVARVRVQLEECLAGRPGQVVVDLTACPFVDATALAMLLEAHRQACRRGTVLTLRGCAPRVLRLLSLTGLRRVFDLA